MRQRARFLCYSVQKWAITQDEAAKRLGVSRGSLQQAKAILDRGNPSLIDVADRNVAPVSVAAALIELSDEELAEVLTGGAKSIKSRAKELGHSEDGQGGREPGGGRAELGAVDPADEAHSRLLSTARELGLLPDREWLEGLPLWDRVPNKAALEREATLWWVVKAGERLQGLAGNTPDRTWYLTSDTSLEALVNSVEPPEQWILCYRCQFTWEDDEQTECYACGGRGFEITRVESPSPLSSHPPVTTSV